MRCAACLFLVWCCVWCRLMLRWLMIVVRRRILAFSKGLWLRLSRQVGKLEHSSFLVDYSFPFVYCLCCVCVAYRVNPQPLEAERARILVEKVQTTPQRNTEQTTFFLCCHFPRCNAYARLVHYTG